MDATSADYARAAFDLIDDFEHTRTPEEVVEQLASSLSLFGFSTILIPAVRGAGRRHRNNETLSRAGDPRDRLDFLRDHGGRAAGAGIAGAARCLHAEPLRARTRGVAARLHRRRRATA